MRPRLGSMLLRVYGAAVATFLLAPVVILIATSFTGSDTVAFPPVSLSLRWYVKLVSHLTDSPIKTFVPVPSIQGQPVHSSVAGPGCDATDRC